MVLVFHTMEFDLNKEDNRASLNVNNIIKSKISANNKITFLLNLYMDFLLKIKSGS